MAKVLYDPAIMKLESEAQNALDSLKNVVKQFPRTEGINMEEKIEDLELWISHLVNDSTRQKDTLRIATWNLKKFSKKNDKYEDKLSAIWKTILYYDLDVIAVQEVSNEDAIKELVQKLNFSSTNTWKYWINDVSHQWPPEKGGFIWTTARWPIALKRCLLHSFGNNFTRIPICAECINEKGVRFCIINVHLKQYTYGGTSDQYINYTEQRKLCEILENSLKSYPVPSIVLGDFNAIPVIMPYKNIFETTETTNVKEHRQFDNILIDMPNCCLHQVADIKTDLTSDPKSLFDHKPIWADIRL